MAACPLCRSATSVLGLNDLIERSGLGSMEAAILEAVWYGRGLPVMTVQIFDSMYRDDPDGGPSQGAMYRAMKRAGRRLNEATVPHGVAVVPAGFRAGYRLLIGQEAIMAHIAEHHG